MTRQLMINVAGSSLYADFDNLQSWQSVLNSAQSIAIADNGRVCARVDLSGLRRWIAFKRISNGSPLYAIGFQETVGAIQRGGLIVAGSNRKCILWLHPSGYVHLE
jgi:hypothetical protein